MLLRKMSLDNFRQYNGKHEISFSTDKEKNVTLIMGDNGAGKTTLSQAFLWCFYGTTSFRKQDSLLSKKAEDSMYVGHYRGVSVSIEMEHLGKIFKITREKSYKKDEYALKDYSVLFSVSYVEDGETKFLSGRELENYVEEILPQGLSQYFFLSGEKIESMSNDIKSGKSKDFANAVNTLLDLDYYKTAIKHLKNIAKEYTTSAVDGFDDKLKSLNNAIEADDTNITTFENNKKAYQQNLEDIVDKIADCKSQLKSIPSSKDLELKRQDREKKLGDAKLKINRKIDFLIDKFCKSAPYFFAESAIKSANETLKEISEDVEEDIPERLHADLIDWIEKRGKCICGLPIMKDDEHFQLLEKWRHIVPPESTGVLAKRMREKNADKERLGEDLYTSFNNGKKDIEEEQDNISSYDSEIERLTEELANAQDTSAIERQKTMYERDRDRLNEDINNATRIIVKCQEDKEQKEKERAVLLKSSDEGRKVLAWKQMAEKLVEGFERELEKDEKKKKEMLTKNVKSAFKQIYGNSFTVDIDEKYSITTSTALEKSSGQGMTVIFAFLAGLLNVIKENQQAEQKKNASQDSDDIEEIKLESYPLVLDAPFSVLDTQRIKSICEVLPKVSEQIIVFIKDTDGNIAKENMKDKIGKCYHLVKVGNSDDDTKIEEE